MDKLNSKAIILTYTPLPEKICASAARISTIVGSATEVYNNTSEASASKLVSNVLKLGHKSIIEHANFNIAFENVSAFVEQFIIEFRLASFTIKSRRYVDFSNMGYYTPDFRYHNELPDDDKQIIVDEYDVHMKFLFSEYEFLVNSGIPKEDARFILPYSYKSNFYCTVNARELIHIIYAALHGRGSKFNEIKRLGESLLEQGRKISPNIFGDIESLECIREDKEIRLRNLLSKDMVECTNKKQICELISYTENPEITVAISGVINHLICTTESARALLTSDTILLREVLNIVCEDKRKRELEQICFTFRINNITLAGLTHLVRHRMQSINIPSFTEFGKSENHIIPDTIKCNCELLQRYEKIWEINKEIYYRFKELGILDEDLIYLYLSGNVLDVVTTMNARQLFHFIQLRSCNRAQWEIRNISIEMLKILRAISPDIFSRLGPSCFVMNKCPEGKMCCGKIDEIKEFFGGL